MLRSHTGKWHDMGGGAGPSAGASRDLSGNIRRLAQEFPVSSAGYFGTPGLSGSNRIRNIVSSDPDNTASRFFSIAGRGGSVTTHKKGNVTVASFGGRFRVVYRGSSTSDGSPVVEIYSRNLPGKHPAYQKIHFTRRNP